MSEYGEISVEGYEDGYGTQSYHAVLVDESGERVDTESWSDNRQAAIESACRRSGGHYWRPQVPGDRNTCTLCEFEGQVFEPKAAGPFFNNMNMPRACIDATCPHCGYPERWADVFDDYTVFGCRKCDYKSFEREV